MSKSMYSLILSDEIVAEIDRLALRQSVSRSAAVNRILAEYVSMVTPEKRIDNVFRQLESLLATTDDLVPMFTPNRTSMYVKSSLATKYRPTVRYEVALYPDPGDVAGTLTVSFRTQSRELLEATTAFFLFWQRLETAYLAEPAPARIEEGRMTRKLRLRRGAGLSTEQLANAISDYVRLLDGGLKAYIADGDAASVEEAYRRYLRADPPIN